MARQSDDFDTVLVKVLNFLSFRARSTQEVKNRLNLYSQSQDVKDRVIVYLQDHKLLDDYQFAKEWVLYRQARYSRRRLELELRQKGISPSVISRVFKQESQDKTLIKQLILKKANKQEDLAFQVPKLTRYLLSKGFSMRDIKDIFYELERGC